MDAEGDAAMLLAADALLDSDALAELELDPEPQAARDSVAAAASPIADKVIRLVRIMLSSELGYRGQVLTVTL